MIGQDTFSALAPVQGKKMAMSPSSAVHGDQYDTKYVTFELLLHAAFVADEIWGFTLEPTRTTVLYSYRLVAFVARRSYQPSRNDEQLHKRHRHAAR